jgi:hypothetical protein
MEPTPVPPGPPRLAFTNEHALFVVRLGEAAVRVGEAGHPVWSLDGRYLAWSVPKPAAATSTPMNAPTDSTVSVLDTVTGNRIDYRDANHRLNGDVLAVPGGFAAVISGQNNLGKEATDIETLRVADGATSVQGTVVHSTLPPSGSGGLDHDMFWADARGDHLFVVVTEASSTWYRYSPALWSVSLDGTATRLFGDCDGKPEGCLSNFGFEQLVVAPDGRHVAFESGVRNGCDAWTGAQMTGLASFSPTPLRGLPTPQDSSATLSVTGISWAGTDQLLLAALPLSLPQGTDAATITPAGRNGYSGAPLEGHASMLV